MVFDDVQPQSVILSSLDAAVPAQQSATPLSAESLARWMRATALPDSQREDLTDPDSDTANTERKAQPQESQYVVNSTAVPLSTSPHSPVDDAKFPPDTAQQEAPDTEVMQALSLSALRGLHANHRQARVDAFNLGNTVGSSASRKPVPDMLLNDRSVLSQHSNSPAQATTPADDHASSSSASSQLQSLVESCCNRLWVSEGAGGTAQGVMLDLGRWMPGCTVEVARTAGVLRVTLRGVDEARRRLVEQELDGLGEALAQKLGCQVVAAVETQKESP
jgi:hypothetical protein